MISSLRSLLAHYKSIRELNKIYIEEQGIFKSEDPKVLYVFADKSTYSIRLVYKAIGKLLSNKGHMVSFLFKYKGDSIHNFPIKTEIGDLSNSLTEKERLKEIHSDLISYEGVLASKPWCISDGAIFVDNVDFTEEIVNTLRTYKRMYDVDLDANTEYIDDVCASIYIIMSYYREMVKFSVKNKITIKIVGFEHGYVPCSIFLKMSKITKEIETADYVKYIELNHGYATYFGLSRKDRIFSAANLTDGLVDATFQPSNSEFQNFINMTSPRNVSMILSQEMQRLIDRSAVNLDQYQDRENLNVLILPHLFYDAKTNDSSHLFSSMTDWFTETIKFLLAKESVNIFVKPHPAEASKHVFSPNQTAQSLLNTIGCQNDVTLLPHIDFSQAIEDIDVVVVWRSTAALEASLLSKKIVVAGEPVYGNVIDIEKVTLDDYFKSIVDGSLSNNSIEPEIAALYLYYCRNYLHFRLGWISQKNGRFSIDMDYFNKYVLTDCDYVTNQLIHRINQ